MTWRCRRTSIDAFLALARRREVEASVLGEFTDSGRMVVMYGDTVACDLGLEFLHDGLPRWPCGRAGARRRARGVGAEEVARRWPTRGCY
jgi:phosphoribosylformylglycinamidine (FGAM) synthase-like enzyme